LTSSTDNIANIEKIQQYLQNSEHYYKNSQDFKKQNELAKAGEFLWGAIAEAAKALHLMVKGKPINKHGPISNYLRQLSSEYNRNTKIADAANDLHINFYETALSESRFSEQYDNAKLLHGLLMGKVREKSTEQNLV
jgi:Archaeal PaREP1/PaREP8 family